MALPKKPNSRFHKFAQRAYKYIIADDWIKLVSLLADLTKKETYKLEYYYAHYRSDSNNRYKLREDITTYWTEVHLQKVRRKVLDLLQSRNHLPPKKTFSQLVTIGTEAAWPAAQRAKTKLRLMKPETWPSNLRHPILIKRIQQWGEFILSNYVYLAKKRAALELGIRFSPPKSSSGGGDIKAIADYTLEIANANARLLKTCEKGMYWAPVPDWKHRHTIPKGCLESLQKWHEVFSNAKGQVARQMTGKIEGDIRRIKTLQAEKQKVYGK